MHSCANLRAHAKAAIAHKQLSVLGVLAATACLAGCGATKPLTRAQLVSRTDALCVRLHAKMKAAGTASGTKQLAVLARKLASFEQQELESMRELKPPASLASDWRHLVEGVEELAETAGTLSTYVQLKQNEHIAEALKRIGSIEHRVSTIVKRDGFKSCEQIA